jgi:hypothetical protein
MSQEHDIFHSVTKWNTPNTSLHRCVNQNRFRIWRVHLWPYCSEMKQKVILSLYIIKHNTMTTDGGNGGIAPCIFASALDGSGQIYASLPGTHWTGGWVGPRARLDTVKREMSCPCQGSNPDSSVMHPDTLNYNNVTRYKLKCELFRRPGYLSRYSNYTMGWTTNILGFDCWQEHEIFRRLALGPIQPTVQWLLTVPSLEIKRKERKNNWQLPSSAEVKNAWSYTSARPYIFMARCLIKHR